MSSAYLMYVVRKVAHQTTGKCRESFNLGAFILCNNLANSLAGMLNLARFARRFTTFDIAANAELPIQTGNLKRGVETQKE